MNYLRKVVEFLQNCWTYLFMNNNKSNELNNNVTYWRYILYAIAICTLLLAGFGWAVKSGEVVAIELLIGFASLIVGFLVGFLFGLPRAGTQEQNAESDSNKANSSKHVKVSYRPSTNLEQISDWLTKILIGVGLVELGQAKYLLADLGRVIGKLTPGFPGNQVLPQIVLVAYSVLGFFIGYIWTRIEYTKLQVGTDRSLSQEVQSLSEVTELLVKDKVFPSNTDSDSANNLVNDTSSNDVNAAVVDSKIAAIDEKDNLTSSQTADTNQKDVDNNFSNSSKNDSNHHRFEIINNKYPLTSLDTVGWPRTTVDRLIVFNNAELNSGDIIKRIFSRYPNSVHARGLKVKVENTVGSTIVFSASARQYLDREKGEVWFLINPVFGRSRIKRVSWVNGVANVTFSTTQLFTIAAIMDNGDTVLTFDLRETPDLPRHFIDGN